METPTRLFTLLEIVSGLPDDSREEDERAAERTLRDRRGRVNVARMIASWTRELSEALARDGRKAARFGISEAMLRDHAAALDFDRVSPLVEDGSSGQSLR